MVVAPFPDDMSLARSSLSQGSLAKECNTRTMGLPAGLFLGKSHNNSTILALLLHTDITGRIRVGHNDEKNFGPFSHPVRFRENVNIV